MPSDPAKGRRAPQQDFFKRLVLTVEVVLIAALAVTLVISAASVLLLLFAGILLAVFLRSCANLLAERTPLTPGWGVLAVVTALVLLLAGGLVISVPHVVGQFGALGDQLEVAISQIVADLEGSSWGSEVLQAFPDIGDVQGQVGTSFSRARGVFSTTLGVLVSGFLVVVIGLYFAAAPGVYVRGVLQMVTAGERDRTRLVLAELRITLFRWLLGRLVGMVVIGVATGVGLFLLGVPLAFTLGLLAALLTFVPNIGPVVAAVPAVVLAMVKGLDTMIWVVVVYTTIQILESYLLTPLVARRTVSLPPVLTIVFQVIMGLYLGILGLLLASPLAATILVLVKVYYLDAVLDEDIHLRSEDGASP